MKINKTYSFTINISCEAYATKPGGAEISKMRFTQVSVTPLGFAEFLKKGHSFCPNFNTPGRRSSQAHWTGSQFVCVDIDDTMYEEIPDFIGPLRYRPTIVYPSYSDGIGKEGKTSRRFHLVYIFDELITNPEIFTRIAQTISRSIEEDTSETITDKTWIDRTRYFNGTPVSNDYYVFGNIWNQSDFLEISSSITYFGKNDRPQRTPVQEIVQIEKSINKQLLRDIDNLDHDKFYYFWGPRLKYVYESGDTEPGVESFYRVTGDDYFKLPFWKTRKLDGSHRRIWVYTRMCLRRVMCPEIDINTLIYCAYQDVYFSVDNSDGVFNSEYYRKNALAAFEYTIEATADKFSRIIEYYRSVAPKIRTSHERLQEARFLEYDNKGVPDNISERTMYRYKNSRGLVVKTDWTEMMSHYDDSLSINKNLGNLKQLGYKVSKGKLCQLVQQRK